MNMGDLLLAIFFSVLAVSVLLIMIGCVVLLVYVIKNEIDENKKLKKEREKLQELQQEYKEIIYRRTNIRY